MKNDRKQPALPRDVFTISEVMAAIRKPREAWYQLPGGMKPAHYRIGRMTYITRAAFDEWMIRIQTVGNVPLDRRPAAERRMLVE